MRVVSPPRAVLDFAAIDGHSSRMAFEKDRRKWAALMARGLTVMPLATRTAKVNQGGTVALVNEMLRQAAAREAA